MVAAVLHGNMHQAPHAERLELYRAASALGSWDEAKAAALKIQEIEKNSESNMSSVAHSLRVAFYILYGRPFKQRPSIRMEEEIVPASLLPVHKSILTLRDKMFAHTDRDLVSSQGDPLNRIIVQVKPQSLSFGFNTLQPRKDSIVIYLRLLDELIKKALYRRNKIARRWARHFRLAPGTQWAVNISQDSNDILVAEPKVARIYSHELQE